MKKQVLILAALLAGACSLSVMADPAITMIDSFEDTEWIDGSNLLKVRGENGYFVADISGNALTEDGFGSFYCDDGYITAQKYSDTVNSTGLMTMDGQLITDCIYGDIKIQNAYWAVAYVLKDAQADNFDYQSWFSSEDKYYLVDYADIYYLDGASAVKTASLPRENLMDVYADNKYLSVEDRASGAVTMYDSQWNVVQEGLNSVYSSPDFNTGEYEIFTENGQQGIKNSDGTVICSPAFHYIYDIHHGYANVSTGDKEGLTDIYGNVIVPAEADNILTNYYAPFIDDGDTSKPYVSGGYVGFEQDGKVGYYDLNGNLTMQPTYSKDILEVNGVSAVLTDLEGNVHILAADGTDTVLDDEHKDLRCMYYSNGYLYTFRNEDYDCGVMDWHGNELIPIGYSDASLSGDGLYMLAEVDYDHSELYEVSYGEGVSAAPALPAEPETAAEGGQETGGESFEAVKALIDSAAALIQADYEANRESALSLLDTASTLLGDMNQEASSVLQSTLTLIRSDAGTQESAQTLLKSLSILLG